ncbi:MAG: zf-HC2 domain-containing protein [Actinobacteria bacterium]|nr:zf-HC2 domain-containing protein [Actinomycetota bacterium]
MNCSRLVELITDYLESAMPEGERALADEHLSRCDGCTTYLAQFRTTIALTGMLTEEDVSPEAREALLGVFRDLGTTA